MHLLSKGHYQHFGKGHFQSNQRWLVRPLALCSNLDPWLNLADRNHTAPISGRGSKNFLKKSKNCQNIKMISSWGIDNFELHSITIFEWKTCSFRLLITLNLHRNTKPNQNWLFLKIWFTSACPSLPVAPFVEPCWEPRISKSFRNSRILMQLWFKGLVIFSYFTKNDNLRSF